jgi:hypothetical protein
MTTHAQESRADAARDDALRERAPGRSPTTPIELEYGEPGVKKGQ